MAENIEQEARNVGWLPQEEYKGDPERWVDAETYVERGRTIMPILKKNNETLQQELAARDAQIAELRAAVSESKESVTALQTYYSEETKRKVAEVRKDLVEQLKVAKREGDVDSEVEVSMELTRLDAEAAKAAEKADDKPATPPPAATPQLTPEFREWQIDNPWFGTDKRRTSLAITIAGELRKAEPGLVGVPFFNRVKQELNEFLGVSPPEPKADGGGSTSTRRSSGGQSYADLPADAKAACDRYAKQVVGANRTFKDVAAWRAHYTKEYFEEA